MAVHPLDDEEILFLVNPAHISYIEPLFRAVPPGNDAFYDRTRERIGVEAGTSLHMSNGDVLAVVELFSDMLETR